MALFTEAANASTVIRCESIAFDGTHQYYAFGVIDENNNMYDWRDTDLAEGANQATVKSTIKTHLTTNVHKRPAPPSVTVVSDDGLIGNTLA